MKFPKVNFADEQACFQTLFDLVHPKGRRCPRCGNSQQLVVHKHHHQSWIVDHRCLRCGRVFNAWTKTPFAKTHHPPSEILRIIKGMVEGKSTSQLAQKLGFQRPRLSTLMHRWQSWVTSKFGPPRKKRKGPTKRRPGSAPGKSEKSRKRKNP